MNTARVLASIVIPNRNKERFIAETLRSVQAQSNNDWEVIFVDDNSTDSSLEIASEFSQKDARIRCSRLDDGRNGGSAARNHGIKIANGKFILFLDSDDLLVPCCLSQRLSRIEPDASDFAVFTMGTFNESIGDRSKTWKPNHRTPLLGFLSHHIPWSVMSPIFRTDFVRGLGGFDERFPRMQDIEFHTRCLMAPGVKFRVFRNLPPDCFYRVAEHRSTNPKSSQLETQIQGMCLYLESFLNPAKNHGDNYVSALSVTAFRAFERICKSLRSKEITTQQFATLRMKIEETSVVTNLPDWKSRLLQRYVATASRKPLPRGSSYLLRKILER